jgi:glycosyltransferase involved in cell wall biosynthesis
MKEPMNFRYRIVKRLARWFAQFVSPELRQAIKNRIKAELKQELKTELKSELKPELMIELMPKIFEALQKQLGLANSISVFKQYAQEEIGKVENEAEKSALIEVLSNELRSIVRESVGLPALAPQVPIWADLLQEASCLQLNQALLEPVFKLLAHKRVLFAGQAYYNAWYLSRALRDRGWKADVLNWDENPASQIYYHGEDFKTGIGSLCSVEQCVSFYINSIYNYDVYHFSNAHAIGFGFRVSSFFEEYFERYSEIFLLKKLGKKIVYTNNGCLDGVSQSAFSKWGPHSVCSICRWKNEPSVCSDERNLAWGAFKKSVVDYQCLLGGNRVDYNDDPRVHEVPEFYCLDAEIWSPNIEVPDSYRLSLGAERSIRLYHAVGNRADRTSDDGVNIKSSHVYLPLVEKLRQEGLQLELLEPTGVPNKEVRFLQVQADIFLDMLTFGWFGANAREAMMLAKPVICYIRPEWLESVREEIPEYADTLPIVSATPETIEAVLRDLLADPLKRQEIGRKSRDFAIKWHSAGAAGKRFDIIYSRLLQGDALLRNGECR